MADKKPTKAKPLPKVGVTSTAKDHDQCAEVTDRSAWLDTLDLLLHTPSGRKLAIVTVIATVFILTIVIHYAAKSITAEKSTVTTDTGIPPSGEGSKRPDQVTPMPQVKVFIPPELLEPKNRKKVVVDSEDEPAPLLKFDPKLLRLNLESIGPPLPPPPPPPEPPKYLASIGVRPEISLNHADAATSNQEIVTRGFTNLPDATRAWVVRRFTTEAQAYQNAVAVGWTRFVDLRYSGRAFLVGKQQFEIAYVRLGQAQAALRGRMTDADCAWVIEQLRFAVQFLNGLNRNALRNSPITLPNFFEQVNPAWEPWQRAYGSNKRD